jgi:hypothetical protein
VGVVCASAQLLRPPITVRVPPRAVWRQRCTHQHLVGLSRADGDVREPAAAWLRVLLVQPGVLSFTVHFVQATPPQVHATMSHLVHTVGNGKAGPVVLSYKVLRIRSQGAQSRMLPLTMVAACEQPLTTLLIDPSDGALLPPASSDHPWRAVAWRMDRHSTATRQLLRPVR